MKKSKSQLEIAEESLAAGREALQAAEDDLQDVKREIEEASQYGDETRIAIARKQLEKSVQQVQRLRILTGKEQERVKQLRPN